MGDMTEREYQATAITDMHDKNEAKRAAYAKAVELLTPVVQAEYQFNRSPRGCSPGASYRETMDTIGHIVENLRDDLTSKVTDQFLADRRS